MSRREEVEAELREMDDHHSARYYTNEYSKVAIALADEVDALRAENERIITELLTMLKPEKHQPSWIHAEYARACEIAGRTE